MCDIIDINYLELILRTKDLICFSKYWESLYNEQL